MAAAPHESDAPGKVVVSSHRITTRVKAEPSTKAFTTEPAAKRKQLKKAMRHRQDVEDEVIEDEGMLDAAARKTNRRLRVFAQRLAAAHVTPRVKGEKSPQYIYVMDGKSPSKLLPKDRQARRQGLSDFEQRVNNDKKAGPEAARLAVDLFKAMEKEEAAHVALDEKEKKLAEAREAEEEAKREVVVAVRVMANEVQVKFAADPAFAREVLGYGDSAATRRKNVAQQKKAAKKAVPVEE